MHRRRGAFTLLIFAWSAAAHALSPAHVGLRFMGERVRNFSGGLATGETYDDNVYLTGDLNTAAAGLWAGGHVHVEFFSITSGQPSSTLIGDEQGASNIAAPDQAGLYAFWYRQRFDEDKFVAIAGIRAVNGSFLYSTYGNYFVNDSFGIPPTLPLNEPVSTWPQLGYGAQLAYKPDKKWRLITGVFQGNPERRGAPFDTGVMSISEVDFCAGGTYAGCYKAGFWYDHAHRSPISPDLVSDSDRGIYAYADKVVWHGMNRHRLGAFIQFSETFGVNHLVNRYWEAGIMALGWLPDFPGSGIGIGAASAHNGPAAQRLLGIPAAETAWEVTGIWRATQAVALQPDFQYIQNPSLEKNVPNAFVGIIRIIVTFGARVQ